MRRTITCLVIMGAAAMILFAACRGSSDGNSGSGTTTTGSASDRLAGTAWNLQNDSLGVPVPAGARVTARFTKVQIAGDIGCNSYTASYSTSGKNRIILGPLAWTRKTCALAKSPVQGAYLTKVRRTIRYAIDDDTLSLRTKDGTVLLRFKPDKD